MRLFIAAYGSTAVCMLGLDILWLSTMTKPLYRAHLGNLFRPDVDMKAAALFYFLYVFGCVWLAVLPGVAAGAWTTAAAGGAVLGLVAYATYDLTNQATLAQWSTTVTIADMCWGTLLTCVSSTAGFFGARAFGGTP